MSKILIFGPGYLGTRFHNAIEGSVLSKADIADPVAVREQIELEKPDAVLNCAGKTGKPNIDWCETNQFATYRSNTTGSLVLAEACQEKDIYFVQLASGCIFYGDSPDPTGWRENDFANPESVYSRSKYASDLLLAKIPNVAIVRLRMPIDSIPSPRNLINKLAAYPKVINVENSVTVVEDLIAAVIALIEKRGTGIFHAVNQGTMRHQDLIELYNELVDPTHTNEWITDDEMMAQGLAKAKRSNCILQNTRFTELGIQMRPIDIALRDCMEKYAVAWKARNIDV